MDLFTVNNFLFYFYFTEISLFGFITLLVQSLRSIQVPTSLSWWWCSRRIATWQRRPKILHFFCQSTTEWRPHMPSPRMVALEFSPLLCIDSRSFKNKQFPSNSQEDQVNSCRYHNEIISSKICKRNSTFF